MIRRVEALRYRCLRYVDQRLGPFQILVGPNASGKSAFLDVVGFVGDLLKHGPLRAVRDRSPNLQNLVWMEKGEAFELAVELAVPEERLARLATNGYTTVRYEVSIGMQHPDGLAIRGENLWLKRPRTAKTREQGHLFPNPPAAPANIVLPDYQRTPLGSRKVLTKKATGNDYFRSEITDWNNQFRLGPQRAALANLPEDETRFPVSTWVKQFLMEGVQRLVLNSEMIRRPAPPGSPAEFQPDGSNLPWAIEGLKKNKKRFTEWVGHLRTALPDLRDIDTVEREEDRHRYVRVRYETGHAAPSWTLSDGTLRLLALTLIGYLEAPNRIYLIEEPENGIHPRAVETVFQSLSSAYDSQILCATHSPIFLSLAEPENLLCFAKAADGASDVVLGSEHPNLGDWQESVDLGTLFAAGVLG